MRDKLISLRFAAKCRSCGKQIQAGERAYWRKGYGSRHVDCNPQSDSPEIETGEVTVLDYATIRDRFKAVVAEDSYPVSIEGNRKRLSDLKRSEWTRPDWTGCTIADMKDWIANGFKVAELSDLHPDLIPVKPRRKLKFDEDGELQLDLVFSGFDYPFLEWEKREKKPGIRVNIGFTFDCGVSARMVADYATWLARALTTLENEGFDAEVNLRMTLTDLWSGGPLHSVEIRVKRENEAADFSQWSAIFSPGGFRMLGFVGLVMAADLNKRTATGHLGFPKTANDWKVSFDAETRTLAVENPDGGRGEFPTQRLTDDLRSALETARKAG